MATYFRTVDVEIGNDEFVKDLNLTKPNRFISHIHHKHSNLDQWMTFY